MIYKNINNIIIKQIKHVKKTSGVKWLKFDGIEFNIKRNSAVLRGLVKLKKIQKSGKKLYWP